MYLFSYEPLTQREIESKIQRTLDEPLHGRLPGFKLTVNQSGKRTVTPAESPTVPGLIWHGITMNDLEKLDMDMTPTWQRARNKVLAIPKFPLEYSMYVIADAWVYVEPFVSV